MASVICDYLLILIPSGGVSSLFVVGKCNLADLLRKADLTQVELAELTNIPKSSISGYVNGTHTMSLISAYRISYVLRCDIKDLYQWNMVRDAKRR
jgi:putative transcriptional regulator